MKQLEGPRADRRSENGQPRWRDESSPGQGDAKSIQQVIREGELGALLDALDDIRDGLKDCSLKIEFPTVIVCGQESTGKSSVLERICMFPFFPRDHGITTRMPINLRLRHDSIDGLIQRCAKESKRFLGPETMIVRISFKDSESRVYVVSAQNPDDASKVVRNCQSYVLEKHSSNKSFCIEPLIMEAWGNSLPDMDLVDLPGVYSVKVQNESFDIVETTRRITEEYLRKQSTLVVAVVPATSERIRNDVVLGMVQRAGKEDWTVCALTKSDKCHRSEYNSADPFMDLKERARGRADDCPRLGGGFVAVRNRDSRDQGTVSLQESADRERSWFQNFMPDLVHEGCATADCLVKKIGDMMVRYTTKTWSNNAISQIEQHRRQVVDQVRSLGEDPSLNPDGLLMQLLSYAGQCWKQLNIGQELSNFVRAQLAPLSIDGSGASARSDPAQSKQFKAQCDALRTSVPSFFEGVPAIFSAALSTTMNPRGGLSGGGFGGFSALDPSVLKVERFENFRASLPIALKSRLRGAVESCKQRFRLEFPLLIVSVTISEMRLYTAVERLFCAIILQEMDLTAPSQEELLQVMNQSRLLEENCADERVRLNKTLEALDRAKIQVQKLQSRKK